MFEIQYILILRLFGELIVLYRGLHIVKAAILSLLLIYLAAAGSASAQNTASPQKIAFDPVDHSYIYDIKGDGSVRCTWSTTIVPKEPSILYTFSFRGGETKDYTAEDSLGQMIDADVNEANGERTISMLLAGYQVGEPYKFNLSFTWNGLMTRNGERNTLYTSVNVGEPQSASIVVIPPKDAKIGTSVVTMGNSTDPFKRIVVSGRDALIWSDAMTENETDIVFRANYNYYNAMMSLADNMLRIVAGALIIVVAALLLGYRKRLPRLASKIKERI